jgi:hypothetical protein
LVSRLVNKDIIVVNKGDYTTETDLDTKEEDIDEFNNNINSDKDTDDKNIQD